MSQKMLSEIIMLVNVQGVSVFLLDPGSKYGN